MFVSIILEKEAIHPSSGTRFLQAGKESFIFDCGSLYERGLTLKMLYLHCKVKVLISCLKSDHFASIHEFTGFFSPNLTTSEEKEWEEDRKMGRKYR